MPTFQDYINRREAETEKADADTALQVRILQGLGYTAVIEWVMSELETDNGKIKTTAKNFSKVSSLYKVLGEWQVKYKGTMLGRVLDWAGRIINLNDDYFGEIEDVPETLQDKARKLVLQRWGYDGKNIIPGGYFEYLFNNQAIAQRVAGLVNQSIQQGISLAEFQKLFKSVFVGKPGLGMLERHWKTNSFDLFMRIDRATNLVYADELGFNFAIYSGTLEKDSRPFCIKRVNKVFSRDEISGWKSLDFAGKPKIGYDPFIDLGGYNCRHHLSFISKALAEKLKLKQE